MEVAAGGGGEGTWPHGLSQAAHMVHSIWYLEEEVAMPEAVELTALAFCDVLLGRMARRAKRASDILRILAIFSRKLCGDTD